MSYIITIQQAQQQYQQGARFVDCRFSLDDSTLGENEYRAFHLPNAVYMNLEKDLSGPVREHGGRHPLPELDKFKQKLEEYGITAETELIAYDQGGAPFAARFWWLMRYIGHKKVFVLNGGIKEWQKAGYPVESSIPSFEKSNYQMTINHRIHATIEDVMKSINGQENATIIDSREHKRYVGDFEPIDKKAGHIPGAINRCWIEGFQGNQFLDEDLQRKRFAPLQKDEEIIVYCGSGVTAAPNVLLLNSVGFSNVKLYIGSFSDWVSYDDNIVEKGNDSNK